ncbi:ROK family protein [Amycolatopsis nigrescens]|uniref:ROK family protein n=1 Tax=Amycolatopsis nigrescens TaxID=381445 RepID=UPI00037E60BD|nr:ROK family protein [Amycolatopsis nigrescens]
MTEKLVAAFDVGGTSVKAALLDEELRQLAALREPTARGTDGTATAEAIGDQVARLVAGFDRQVAAVGVVIPGIVDDQAGIARFSANLGWREVPFADLLRRRLDVPVAFGHDVTAGGLAEYRLGAARGFASAVVLPVGTGIAAALLLDGRPYRAGGLAGELGHIDVGHQEKCGCGATGCLEAIASAAAIARRFAARTGRPAAGAEQVVQAARAGDPDAAAVLEEAVHALGRGIHTLTTLLAPEVVVLGGGLFGAGDFVLDPLRHWLSARLTFQRMPELRVAELGDEAGCLGAGLLALEAAG